MAKSNHDDLAAALQGLSSGEISSDEESAAAEEAASADWMDLSGAPTPSPIAPAAPAASPARAAPPPPARATARPAPAKPLEPAPSIPTARAAAATQRTPPGQPRRPAPPAVEPPAQVDMPAESEVESQQAIDRERQAAALAAPIIVTEEPTVDEGDDRVIIPALAPSSARPRSAAPRIVSPPPPADGLHLRRTLIPILLTLAALLPACGAAKYIVDPASPLAALPAWLTAALFVAGAIFLVLAVVNMLQVRRAMEERGRA